MLNDGNFQAKLQYECFCGLFVAPLTESNEYTWLQQNHQLDETKIGRKTVLQKDACSLLEKKLNQYCNYLNILRFKKFFVHFFSNKKSFQFWFSFAWGFGVAFFFLFITNTSCVRYFWNTWYDLFNIIFKKNIKIILIFLITGLYYLTNPACQKLVKKLVCLLP